MMEIKLTENQKIAYERWLNKNVYMLEETKDVLHNIDFYHTATITEEQAEILRKTCPLGFILNAIEGGNNDQIHKIQDDEGNWYWIPNALLTDFKNDLNKIVGKEYLDCSECFDDFSDKYGMYETGGDADNVPVFFEKK